MSFNNFSFKLIFNILFFTFTIILLHLSIILQANSNDNKDKLFFQSLRFDESYMRAGPGKRYPIKWIFLYKGLPVKILDNYENWRKIEVHDGTKGWMHKSQLSKNRTIIFITDTTLYNKPKNDSSILAYIEISSILVLKNCGEKWCKVYSKEHNLSGYIYRETIWGEKAK